MVAHHQSFQDKKVDQSRTMEYVERDSTMSPLEETEIRKQCVVDIINILQDSKASEKEDHLKKIKMVFNFRTHDSSDAVIRKLKTVLKKYNKAVITLHKTGRCQSTIKSNMNMKVNRNKKLEIRLVNINNENTRSFKKIKMLDKARKEKKHLRDEQEKEMNKLRTQPLQPEYDECVITSQADFLAAFGLCSASHSNISVSFPRINRRTRRTAHGQTKL